MTVLAGPWQGWGATVPGQGYTSCFVGLGPWASKDIGKQRFHGRTFPQKGPFVFPSPILILPFGFRVVFKLVGFFPGFLDSGDV